MTVLIALVIIVLSLVGIYVSWRLKQTPGTSPQGRHRPENVPTTRSRSASRIYVDHTTRSSP